VSGRSYDLKLTFNNNGSATWNSSFKLVAVGAPTTAAPPAVTELSPTAPTWVNWLTPPPPATGGVARRTCAIETDCDSTLLLAGADGSVGPTETGAFTTKVRAPTTAAPMNFCLRSGAAAYFGECFSWDPHLYTAGTGQLPPSVCVPTAEMCNGADDDCDGVVDDLPAASCYGGPPATRGVGMCRDGTQACSGGTLVCLGDVRPSTNPDTCNGHDDDCDGSTDEDGGATTYYADFDGDDFVDRDNPLVICGAPPNGYKADPGTMDDCCDLDARSHDGQTAYFGSPDSCNSFDYNCDASDERELTTFQDDFGACQLLPGPWPSQGPWCSTGTATRNAPSACGGTDVRQSCYPDGPPTSGYGCSIHDVEVLQRCR
jgi:hypothetical protein